MAEGEAVKALARELRELKRKVEDIADDVEAVKDGCRKLEAHAKAAPAPAAPTETKGASRGKAESEAGSFFDF